MKITKELKKKGKVEFDGPKKKSRKKFAPASKVEPPKKGKGAFKREKNADEDEETPVTENASIINFLEAIVMKNYNDAHKYLHQAVETRLQDRIKDEIAKPLF